MIHYSMNIEDCLLVILRTRVLLDVGQITFQCQPEALGERKARPRLFVFRWGSGCPVRPWSKECF